MVWYLKACVFCTDQVLVAAVDGQVAQRDGHSSDHLVGVGAQQLHQDGKALLLTDRGSDVIGPLEGRQRECCDSILYNVNLQPQG